MSELLCEEIAHRAGFIVSVGNWIAPDGTLIAGENYDSHHWETLKKHLGHEPETDNHLGLMNEKVQEGFVRMVFRADVFFQVGCGQKEDIWADDPEMKMMKMMREILEKIPDIEIHIFSKAFYVIGLADDILKKNFHNLQIRET